MTTNCKSAESLPVTSLVALSQTAVGCGVGLLIAGRLRAPVKRTTAITMLSIGLLSSVSLAVGFAARLYNRPESPRGMRRRLRSIREDSGFPDDAEIF